MADWLREHAATLGAAAAGALATVVAAIVAWSARRAESRTADRGVTLTSWAEVSKAYSALTDDLRQEISRRRVREAELRAYAVAMHGWALAARERYPDLPAPPLLNFNAMEADT